MEIKDLIITPFYLLIFYIIAYTIRPYVTDRNNRKFFIPALFVRFFGAISLGLIYQFYYDGGDTFNYFTHGSKWIWEALSSNPLRGIKLILGPNVHSPEVYEYSSKIWYFRSTPSYFIVHIVAFFDIFTFHTYSSTALFFCRF